MAATTHRWRNTSGDHLWATVANWDSGALPGSGGASLDTVIFDGVSQADCYGADHSGDNKLLRLVTMPAYTGNIGTSGNPLIHEIDSVGTTNGRLIHRGSGQFFFEGKAASFSAIVVDAPLTNTAAMTVDGTVFTICVKRGQVNILSTCSVTSNLVVNGTAAYVTMEAIAAAETTPPRVVVAGGILHNYRATVDILTSILAVGPNGTLYQYGLVDDKTFIMQLGGRFVAVPTSQPATPWPDMFCNGHFVLSQTPYDIGIDYAIIGQLANVDGAVGAPDLGWKGAYIDLRKDYP